MGSFFIARGTLGNVETGHFHSFWRQGWDIAIVQSIDWDSRMQYLKLRLSQKILAARWSRSSNSCCNIASQRDGSLMLEILPVVLAKWELFQLTKPSLCQTPKRICILMVLKVSYWGLFCPPGSWFLDGDNTEQANSVIFKAWGHLSGLDAVL